MERNYNEDIVVLVPLKEELFLKERIKVTFYDDFIDYDLLSNDYMLISYCSYYDIINNGYTYIYQPEIKDAEKELQDMNVVYSSKKILKEVSFKTVKGKFYLYKGFEEAKERQLYFENLVARLYENLVIRVKSIMKEDFLSILRVKYFYDGQAAALNLSVYLNDNENFEVVTSGGIEEDEVTVYSMSAKYENEDSGYQALKDIAYKLDEIIKENIAKSGINLSKKFRIEEINEYD